MKEWITYTYIHIFIAESMKQFTNRKKEQGNGKYISHFKFPTQDFQNISRLCYLLYKKICFWTLGALKKLKGRVNGTPCAIGKVISNKVARWAISIIVYSNIFAYFITLN